MAGAWAWARSELRRQRRATVALVLLIAVSGAVALTAASGARRTDTAFDRLIDSSATADVRLQYSTDDPVDDQVLAALRSHPDVVEAHQLFVTLVVLEGSSYDLSVFAGPDPGLFTDVDKPRLLEGRLPDPGAVDEVLANRFTADVLGLEVGATLELATFTPEQLEGDSFEAPAGPRIDLTVVGISRLADEIASPEFTGFLGTPAFHDAYWGEAFGYGPSVEVLTRPGADAEAAVREAIDGFRFDEVEMATRDDLRAQVEDGTHTMAVGLAAFAAAAALATIVASGQALHRRVAGAAIDQPTLSAIGLTGPQRFAASGLVALPAVVAAMLVAVALATMASPLMPIGIARRAEPHPGVDLDLAIVGSCAGALGLGLLLLGALSAWLMTRATSSHHAGSQHTVSTTHLIGRALRGGSSASVHLGVSMALDPGAGRTAVPVRSAIVGSILGVTGVIAALTFGASMTRLADDPGRYGWAWTLAPEIDEADAGQVLDLDGLRDAGLLLHRQVVIDDVQMLGIAVDPIKGSPSLTVRRGRMPVRADEVAFGPKTADELGLDLGDVVEAQAGDGRRRLTVVGEVLFPVFNENPFNAGAALHADTIDALAVSDGFDQPIVTFADGISTEEAAERLDAVVPDSVSVYALPSPPPDVANLEAARSLPPALAVFLFVLAVAAVGHALATSVRRRARDIGVVRALGFVGGQVRGAVRIQATTLLAIGVAVGAPLGVAAGRLVWQAVADGLGVQAAPVVPAPALAVLIPVAALVAAALAAPLGRAATRIRAAEALRAE